MVFKSNILEIDNNAQYSSIFAYNEYIDIFDRTLQKTGGSGTSPPVTPIFNYPYVVLTGATGLWTNQDNKLAFLRKRKNSTFWQFYDVPVGYKVVINPFQYYFKNSSFVWQISNDRFISPNYNIGAQESSIALAIPTTPVNKVIFPTSNGGVSNQVIYTLLNVSNHFNIYKHSNVGNYNLNGLNQTNVTIPDEKGLYFFDLTNNNTFAIIYIVNVDAFVTLQNSTTRPFTQGTIISPTQISWTIPAATTNFKIAFAFAKPKFDQIIISSL